MSNKLIKNKRQLEERTMHTDCVITVDENLEKSKVLEDLGLLDNAIGELSEDQKRKMRKLYMATAMCSIKNRVFLTTPALHLMIAGLYTMRKFDSAIWDFLVEKAKKGEITLKNLKNAVMAYDINELPHPEFPSCMQIAIEEEICLRTENSMKTFADTILYITKNIEPLSNKDTDMVLTALQYMNDSSPELSLCPKC
ncbi:hypothetical protein [Blautia obeum]|uniref:Uncharacterized protein n=1 Tax=Blautia obeum TaxID=40520 RepID=A0A411ZUI1_9FIRM|nr:hypothetical protein [Blautia obeum]RGQ06489.1 hypothetical protein DWZ12_04695 [Blautia obeum]